jgi:hypothetical protein
VPCFVLYAYLYGSTSSRFGAVIPSLIRGSVMSGVAYLAQTKPPSTSLYQPCWQLEDLMGVGSTGTLPPRRMYPRRLFESSIVG